MAQTGYTPILIYASSTPGNTPSAANLTSSASGAELALNYADGRLYYKDGSGNVQILAVKMPSGVLPIANGGTNATATPTAGAVAYGTGTAYAFSSAGSSGQVLVSGGTGSPTWSNLSSIGVTTFNAGTTGFTPSTATSGAVTLAGTLATTNGGTGLTSFTANGVVYASSTSALTTGSALTFDGTNLGIGTSSPANTLEIYNASNTQIRVRNGASSLQSYDFGRNGSTGLLTFYGNQTGFTGYVFSGIDGERMRIDSSGNLLVGTTIAANPNTQKMVIKYQSTVGTVNSHLALVGDSATNGQGPQILFSESGDGQNYAGGTIGFVRTGSNSIGDLVFGTRGSAGDSTTVATERMRIDSSGNVGIGTSSPSYPLTVVSNSSAVGLATYGRSSDNLAGTYWFSNNGVTQYAAVTASATEFRLTSTPAAAVQTFYTNAAERMRIDSSGNVLVGGTASRGTTVGASHLDLFNGTAPAGTLTNGISLYSSSGDFNFMDSSGNGYKVGFRNVPAVGTKTSSYTLATGDVGKYVQVSTSGSIVIPNSTFAEGDIVSIFNNTSASVTITCSITTAYISGTDSAKATMTLATRGVATVFFISSTVCVVSGSVS